MQDPDEKEEEEVMIKLFCEEINSGRRFSSPPQHLLSCLSFPSVSKQSAAPGRFSYILVLSRRRTKPHLQVSGGGKEGIWDESDGPSVLVRWQAGRSLS